MRGVTPKNARSHPVSGGRIICHDTVYTDEMKLKNQSPENYENPFALSFKANFMTIHA